MKIAKPHTVPLFQVFLILCIVMDTLNIAKKEDIVIFLIILYNN